MNPTLVSGTPLFSCTPYSPSNTICSGIVRIDNALIKGVQLHEVLVYIENVVQCTSLTFRLGHCYPKIAYLKV